MNELKQRVDNLDISLYDGVPAQLMTWDCRALLGLHSAVASTLGSFTYLEIGSYLGGSLQALIRDPRCARIISIDPRLAVVPDKRVAEWAYEDNSTERMVQLLRQVPGADMTKLVTLDMRSEDVLPHSLPGRPNFCFIDGEHTDEAVLHDAALCMEAIEGEGVIAFHDYPLLQSGIRSFLHSSWKEISTAIAFTGCVFAVEIGGLGMLRSTAIERAVMSKYHAIAWRLASRWPRSPRPLLCVWSATPHLDGLILRGRRRLRLTPQ